MVLESQASELSANAPAETEAESLRKELAELRAENASLKERLASAEEDAATDELTKLPRRRVIEMELEKRLGEVRRGQSKIAVVMFDLDHFKLVNDTYGHAQGDAVLVGFARAIQEHMREMDLICRFGGEEFVAVLPFIPGVSEDNVEEILQRYHDGVQSVNRSNIPGETIPLTVSIGCIIVEGGTVLTPKEILEAADQNLYKSKTGGRNRSTVSRPDEPVPLTITPKQPATVV